MLAKIRFSAFLRCESETKCEMKHFRFSCRLLCTILREWLSKYDNHVGKYWENKNNNYARAYTYFRARPRIVQSISRKSGFIVPESFGKLTDFTEQETGTRRLSISRVNKCRAIHANAVVQSAISRSKREIVSFSMFTVLRSISRLVSAPDVTHLCDD